MDLDLHSEPVRPLLPRLVLYALLAGSVALNLHWMTAQKRGRFVTVANANSRPTYFTMHRIGEAHQYATGRGVRIGIIDHYFGYDAHRSLYAGGADFLDDSSSFREIAEHGLWLTRTLKEIAPDAEIYALNATSADESRKVAAIVKAIEWGVAQKMDVLTYSNRGFSPKYRAQIDAAVESAVAAGVTCVFVHYTHPQNLLPFPMAPREAEPGYDRPGDVNVFHYDYNVLDLASYERLRRGEPAMPLHLSLSSTSVVVAGVVAMLLELDDTLTPSECKEIVVETSRAYLETTSNGPEIVRSCPRMLDALSAVLSVRSRYKSRAAVVPAGLHRTAPKV